MRHTLSAFMELGPMKIRLKQVTLPRQIRIAVILNTKDDDCNKKCALTTPALSQSYFIFGGLSHLRKGRPGDQPLMRVSRHEAQA